MKKIVFIMILTGGGACGTMGCGNNSSDSNAEHKEADWHLPDDSAHQNGDYHTPNQHRANQNKHTH